MRRCVCGANLEDMATKAIPVMHKDLDDPELRELAGELARRTGQNVLDAVKGALRSDLGRAGDVPPAVEIERRRR